MDFLAVSEVSPQSRPCGSCFSLTIVGGGGGGGGGGLLLFETE